MLNVSPRSVRSAAKVQREAIPEIHQMVQDGKVRVKAAAAVASLPKEEQVAAAVGEPDSVKQAANRYAATTPK